MIALLRTSLLVTKQNATKLHKTHSISFKSSLINGNKLDYKSSRLVGQLNVRQCVAHGLHVVNGVSRSISTTPNNLSRTGSRTVSPLKHAKSSIYFHNESIRNKKIWSSFRTLHPIQILSRFDRAGGVEHRKKGGGKWSRITLAMAGKRITDWVNRGEGRVEDFQDDERWGDFQGTLMSIFQSPSFRDFQTTGFSRVSTFLTLFPPPPHTPLTVRSSIYNILNNKGAGKWMVKGVGKGFSWCVADVMDAVRGEGTKDEVRVWLGDKDFIRVCKNLERDGDIKRIRKIKGAVEELGMEEELWLVEQFEERLRWNQEEGVKVFKGLGHTKDFDGIFQVWMERRPFLPHVYAAMCKALGRGRRKIMEDERYEMVKDEVEGMIELEEARWGERNVRVVREAWRYIEEEVGVGVEEGVETEEAEDITESSMEMVKMESRGGTPEGKEGNELKGESIAKKETPSLVAMGPSCGVKR